MATKSGWPNGVPNNLMPYLSVGNIDARHIVAVGLIDRADLSRASQIGGLMPAWFQICVLRTWMRMPPNLHKVLQRAADWPNPGWSSRDAMRCSRAPMSVTRRAARHADQTTRDIIASPSSPPSPWGMLWTSPESLSQKYADLRP